jgi:hypothetical protein
MHNEKKYTALAKGQVPWRAKARKSDCEEEG